MTCIVAVTDGSKVVIGGDSAAVGEREMLIRATRKVFIAGAYGIGFTRSWRMGQLLRYATELPEPPAAGDGEALEAFMVAEFMPVIRQSFRDHGFAKTVRNALSADYVEEGQEVCGAFLVGLRGHIFEVQYDYQVVRPATPYAAVGHGAVAALGSLHSLAAHTDLSLEEKARSALYAAEACTRSVRAPFHLIEVGEADR